MRHVRGRLTPPLPPDAPLHARIRRGLHRLGQGLALHDALLAAPAMAFHFFLSLLPLLVFAGYVVGLVARRRGVEAVLSPLLDNLPTTADRLVKTEVERLAGSGGNALGPLAFATFSWIAAGGLHGLMSAIENVIGTARRSWFLKRLLALGWVAVLLGGFALAAYAIVQWDAAVHARRPTVLVQPSAAALAAAAADPTAPIPQPRRRRAPIVRSSAEKALGLGVASACASVTLAAFYRFSVRRERGAARRLWPGAFVAMALWFAISGAFALYVNKLATYATLYGSTAAVAVLLIWLWLTSLTILVGAELNTQLEGLRD